eukprot:3913616-Rhodomonas_salina.4
MGCGKKWREGVESNQNGLFKHRGQASRQRPREWKKGGRQLQSGGAAVDHPHTHWPLLNPQTHELAGCCRTHSHWSGSRQ